MRYQALIVLLLATGARSQPIGVELQTSLVDLAAARSKARKILVDDERYPVPAQAHAGWRVGIDRQPGHRDMEKLVCAAIVQHNKTMVGLAKQLGVKTRVVGLKHPTLEPLEITRAVNHYGIVVIDRGIDKLLKKHRDKLVKNPRDGPGDGAMARAIHALANHEYAAARTAGASLKGHEAVVWETVRASAVLAWNERNRASHGKEEQEGVRILNAYRVALGLPPLILDKRLHFMARDFAIEMAKGRFLSHQHPTDPTRRTLRRRANRARYKGKLGENVSSEGDGEKAMWRWRADAGHHRLLVTTLFRAVGMGCTKVSVLNFGDITTVKIVGLYR